MMSVMVLLFPHAGIILIRSKGYDLSRYGTPKVYTKDKGKCSENINEFNSSSECVQG